MGFLQHDTNNIILDAVLTDTGRKFLARNDGSFSIVKYGLSDDEVDYNVIKHYGRNVGKEKIEKNTPVFEALTNGTQAQKYRLMSISNPNIIRLPKFSMTHDSGSGSVVKLTRTSNTATVTIKQTISGETDIDPELRDQAFSIQVNDLFIAVTPAESAINTDSQNISTYIKTRSTQSASNNTGGTQVEFSLTQRTFASTLWTTYGTTGNKSLIKTYVKVTGLQTGIVSEFEVQLSDN
jgi:hypothetical protein